MIDLQINSAGIRSTIEALDASERQIERALASTLNRLGAWAKAQATDSMSKGLRMNKTTIRRRLRVTRARASGGKTSITVWMGQNPISVLYLGARQTSTGVKARGGRDYRHAFIATMSSGKRGVFKRRDKKRLKIDLQREDIERETDRLLADDLAKSPLLEARFFGIFERELRWQMQKSA